MALLFVPDGEDVRILGISAAVAFVALNAFVALSLFINTMGENQTSAERQTSVLMLGVGVVLFALAIVTLTGVVGKRRSRAMRAFAAQIPCSVLALGYALWHSSHANGKLAVFALGLELAGFAAVTFGCGPTMQPADQ